jgi:hypothetical protein
MEFTVKEIINKIEEPSSVVQDGLLFSPRRFGQLVVGGYSSFANVDYLPKTIAMDELMDVKVRFNDFLEKHPEFEVYTKKWKIIFQLFIADSKGAYAIGQDEDGVITWFGNLASR